MGYGVLSQVLLMWFFSSAAAERGKKNSFPCISSCSQVQGAETLYGATCSCSPSCLIYNDCCRDAPYQNTGSVNLDQTCMTLSSVGNVSLVSSCPSSSGVWSEACYSRLKTFFPVTSTDTGTSYLNYFCALCNRDTNVIRWPVRLRCYEKGQTEEEIAVEILFSYKSKVNRLRSLSKRSHDNRPFADCHLYAENDDVTFTKSLELRQCFRDHISECWPSWGNETTRKLCRSYLDPVYSLDRIYRNEHCAQCNGKTNWTPKCFLPPTHKIVPNFKTFECIMKNGCPWGEMWHCKLKKCVPPPCPNGTKWHPGRRKCVPRKT